MKMYRFLNLIGQFDLEKDLQGQIFCLIWHFWVHVWGSLQ